MKTNILAGITNPWKARGHQTSKKRAFQGCITKLVKYRQAWRGALQSSILKARFLLDTFPFLLVRKQYPKGEVVMLLSCSLPDQHGRSFWCSFFKAGSTDKHETSMCKSWFDQFFTSRFMLVSRFIRLDMVWSGITIRNHNAFHLVHLVFFYYVEARSGTPSRHAGPAHSDRIMSMSF